MTERRTPRKRRGRRRSIAAYSAVLALLVLGISHDLKLARAPESAPIVAELGATEGSLRTREPGRAGWTTPAARSALREGQAIAALEGARAELLLVDGTALVLDSSGSATLGKAPASPALEYRQLIVRLSRGALHKLGPRGRPALLRKMGAGTGLTPGLVLHAGGARLVPSPDAELSLTPSEIVLVAGTASLETDAGSTALAAGDRAELPEAGSGNPPRVHRPAFAPLGPRAGQRVVAAEADSNALRLRWRVDVSRAPEGTMTAEVSRDPGFEGEVYRQVIGATHPPLKYVEASVRVPTPKAETVYHWRVRAADERVTSPVERLVLSPLPRPEPLHPAPGARGRATMPVELAWSGVADAEAYELQLVSRDDRRVARETRVARNVLALGSLAPGDYEWRVRARGRDGALGAWSESRRLILIADDAGKNF